MSEYIDVTHVSYACIVSHNCASRLSWRLVLPEDGIAGSSPTLSELFNSDDLSWTENTTVSGLANMHEEDKLLKIINQQAVQQDNFVQSDS
jgi:hypothetical protein